MSSTATSDIPDPDLKIILLGDSAVGKSKLVERYLMDDYNPRQLSTYALTLFRKDVRLPGESKVTTIDFWDTAGQETFNRMHPSYYYRAHCCVLVFDVTRKITYQHLSDWYSELREYCSDIPCVLVANKIDVDYNVTRKNFKFAQKHNLPFYFVSAADGTNVVKVFESAIEEARRYKQGGGDVMAEMMALIGDGSAGEHRRRGAAAGGAGGAGQAGAGVGAGADSEGDEDEEDAKRDSGYYSRTRSGEAHK